MLDTASSGYVAIRDDQTSSLSLNEQAFLRAAALRTTSTSSKKTLRVDGRQAAELRTIRLQLGRWDNGAECTAQWGSSTKVTATCTAALVPPSSDHPNEGMVEFSVDLSPMAASEFRLAPEASTAVGNNTHTKRRGNFAQMDQKLQANRILRCLERIILIGGALDTEALAVLPGKWVWKFHISLSVVDHGGNILDACVLAAMATLRHYRKPHVDLQEQQSSTENKNENASNANILNDAPAVLPTMIPSMVKEATPLPLHHTPLSISFGLIPALSSPDEAVVRSSNTTTSSDAMVAILADPTDREEYVQAGVVTIAMNIHSEVCLLDYGGGCELTPAKLKECWGMGQPLVKQLCQLLEDTLNKADEQARADRLERIKQQQLEGGGTNQLLSLTTKHLALPDVSDEVIIQDGDSSAAMMDHGDDEAVRLQAQTEADEEYRRQALDFTVGHRATAVRENDDPALTKPQGGSLLASMLKSVQQQQQQQQVAKNHQQDSSKTTDSVESSSQTAMPPAGVELPPLPASEPKQPPTETPPTEQSQSKKSSTDKRTAETNPMDLDSDEEEETTTMLTSEFQQATTREPQPAPTKAPAKEEEEEADIDDLSMAIKSKKKKKKSSKKK